MGRKSSPTDFFPRVGYTEGITLRDYIAVQAMAALIASSSESYSERSVVVSAFKMADAMLAEKDK